MKGSLKPDYGIDSPAMVCGQFIAGLLATALAIFKPRAFGLQVRWIEAAAALYFLHGAWSMLRYSKSGKLALREKLLDMIPWRGDETVLDVGCGKGLLLVGAARRVKTGNAIGVDVWLTQGLSGNRPESALENAAIEGVRDRVELKNADARELPFEDDSFDVVVSNFVVHEMNTSADRARMLQEMARVLRPGGRLALIDFIFTKECVEILRQSGLPDTRRLRLGGFSFWVAAVLMLGTFQLYAVTATKPLAAEVKSYLKGGPGAVAQNAQ
jgi:ubiquinone/menaquinone biosynthesis C-methylase UbiE